MTPEVKRFNKDLAGYIILNMLAEIDGHFDPEEGQVISRYIGKHFPLGGNFEEGLQVLSTTAREDYPILLQRCAEDFYLDSTEKERLEFIKVAMEVINADHEIDKNENWLINKLYQYWDL